MPLLKIAVALPDASQRWSLELDNSLYILLPRSPHLDVHTSLLDEDSSFAEILWAAVGLCLQGCDC